MSAAPQPKIEATVIVPCYEAAATLRPCLSAILANEGVRFELIVVDDASTDTSAQIALEFASQVIEVETNSGAADCRNLGARHAAGPVLVFVDADEVVERDTLRRYLDALERNPGLAAVVGSYAATTPATGFLSKFKNLQHHHTHQVAEPEGATLHSGLMAIRKDVFEEFGGFEPAFGGASIEDIALGYALNRSGRRILFQPEIQITHLKAYTLGSLLRSDIVHRAIPWTGLMLRERIVRSDLNTRTGNVASVVLAWLIPLLFVAAGWPVGFGLAVLVVLWIAGLNAGLLAACRRELGVGFVAQSIAFLPFMYFYHGVGLLAGIVTYLLGGSVARRRARPEPGYRIRVGSSGSVVSSARDGGSGNATSAASEAKRHRTPSD